MRQIWLYFSFNFYFVIFSCTQTEADRPTLAHTLPGRRGVFVLERAACCLWQRCRRQRPRRPQRPFAAILRSLWQHFGSKANDADNVHDSNGRGKLKKKCYCVVCGSLCSIRQRERERVRERERRQQPQRKNHFKQKQQGKCTKRLRALQFPSSQLHVRFPSLCVCVCASLSLCVCVCHSVCLHSLR